MSSQKSNYVWVHIQFVQSIMTLLHTRYFLKALALKVEPSAMGAQEAGTALNPSPSNIASTAHLVFCTAAGIAAEPLHLQFFRQHLHASVVEQLAAGAALESVFFIITCQKKRTKLYSLNQKGCCERLSGINRDMQFIETAGLLTKFSLLRKSAITGPSSMLAKGYVPHEPLGHLELKLCSAT